MSIFKVEITETLQKIIEVEAEDEISAIKKAKDEYNLAENQEYILDADDHVDTEFNIASDNSGKLNAVTFNKP